MRKFKLFFLFICSISMLQAQITIDGNDELNKLPWNFYFANSYSQNIYNKNIINSSGEITGIRFLYSDNSTEHNNQITIFLGHTTQDAFDNEDAWVDTSELVQVFDGEINFVPGTWVEFNFDTPFTYNGDDHLVIATLESTPGYNSSTDNFVTTPVYYNSALISYSDNVTIDPLIPPLDASTGTTNAVYAYLPHTQLLGITISCVPPVSPVVTNTTETSALISWEFDTTAAPSYEVVYKAGDNYDPYTATDLETVNSEDTSLILNNLSPGTNYVAYVRAICGSDDISTFVGPIEFQTVATSVSPSYLQDFEGNEFPPRGWLTESLAGNEWELQTNEIYAHSGEHSMKYNYHPTSEADAWIFTIGIDLEAGKTYNIGFWQKVQSSSYAEKLQLTVGDDETIDSQTTVLWDNDNLINTDYEERQVTFTPNESSTYFFAFHAYSDANQFAIFIDDFSVEENVIFTLQDNSPGSYWYSSIDYADYDNDGDADLLITGAHTTAAAPYEVGDSTTHIYDNDGNGNYTLNENIIIQGVHAGDAKWLDFDYDGDLDIIMMGIDYATAFNMYGLYENDNGVYTEVEVDDIGSSWGGISLGDYDNDGDIDVLIAGWDVASPQTASSVIWRNDNGSLIRTDISDIVPGIFDGRAEWVDVDNDMDLDIVISEDYNGAEATLRIYTNENGNYTLSQSIAEGNSYGRFALGDYNNDGFVDIAVGTTNDNYENFIQILSNNHGTFEFVYELPSVSSSAASTPIAWGDYDNDGDLDLVISGLTDDYAGSALLYQNSNGSFAIVEETGFEAVGGHSLAWQDIDGDMDLDILITGFTDDDPVGEFYATSRLYRNLTEVQNTAPFAPQTLSSEIVDGVLIFNWSGAFDEQTPEIGLNYYLQVGTISGGIDVAHYPVTGNAWKLENFPTNETLYWCVKSIDTSFIQSACSEEQIVSNDVSSICTPAEPGLEIGDTGCVNLTYQNETIGYTTVRAADGNVWLQQNLGSNQVANNYDDAMAYGDLFQWGRFDDGHQVRNSLQSDQYPMPNNPLGLGTTGNTNYFVGSGSGSDYNGWWGEWTPEDKWEASSFEDVTATMAYDPCKAIGEDWFIPSENEWELVIAAEEIGSDNEVENLVSAFQSNLKLTVGGVRRDDELNYVDERAYYWSRSISDNDYVKFLYLSNYIVNPNAGGYKNQGSSVRCMKPSSLGIKDFSSLDKNIQLYPNPVKDGIMYLYTNQLQEDNLKIKLYNSQGKLVLNNTYPVVNKVIKIDVSQLSTGKYFMQYVNKQEKGTIGVIIN